MWIQTGKEIKQHILEIAQDSLNLSKQKKRINVLHASSITHMQSNNMDKKF